MYTLLPFIQLSILRSSSLIRIAVNSKGFTLLEALVAMAILAIGITAVIQLFSGALKSVAFSEEYTKALITSDASMKKLLLQDEIEPGEYIDDINNIFSLHTEIIQIDEERTELLPYDIYLINLTIIWMSGSKEKSYTITSTKLIKKSLNI